MERDQERQLRRLAVALAIAGSLSLGACRGSERSFGALLAKIDASPASVSTATFLNAARLADGTAERLRLLKRAHQRGGSLYSDTASAILASGMVTEPLALVAFDAFMSSALYDEALALFDGPLDPDTRADCYAEALSMALARGMASKPGVERFVASSDATGDSRFLVYAAVEAMLDGDRERARTLLIDSEESVSSTGYVAPYRLLWDAGAIDILTARSGSPDDPLQIAVIADAEYMSGNIAEASASYAYIIRNFPRWSWKPYAALARFDQDLPDAPLLAWPNVPDPGSYAVQSGSTYMKTRLYDSMRMEFTDSEGASLEYARWLHASGRIPEARDALAALDGEAARIARLGYEESGRVIVESMRLIADYPGSAAAYDAALLALARIGSWSRFEDLYEKMEAAGLEGGLSWFWRSVSLALLGDAAGAASELRRIGPESVGYSAVYDLGVLELAASRPHEAAEAFIIAAGRARQASDKSKAYIMAGDAWHLVKRYDQARAAYEAALGADIESREARSRLERLRILTR